MTISKKNKLNGWIFIDKPKNITSYHVIRRLKKILNINKIGHAGTLDPFATGILAIAVGEATKSIHYFNQNKVYAFNVVFGESKDTDDITGKTINKSNVIPKIEEIHQCLKKFIGKHTQVPPQYSAVKINGKRAYRLARNNQKFVIQSKNVFIKSLKCLGALSKNEYSFIMECSTGTYVRSIARDLGKMLGSYAYVSELRRLKIGKIAEKDIILLDKFEELVHIGHHFEAMHSIRDVLDDIPAVLIDHEVSQKFRNGLSFEYQSNKSISDYLLIVTRSKFVGIGKVVEGNIKPVRVFNL